MAGTRKSQIRQVREDLALMQMELETMRAAHQRARVIQAPEPTNALPQPSGSIEWYDERFYKVITEEQNIVFLPSVTTILSAYPSAGLTRWIGEVGNQEAKRRMHEAGEAGSIIHHACYTHATGGAVTYRQPVEDGFAVWKQEQMLHIMRFEYWLRTVRPTIEGAELTVFSTDIGCAGTLDYVMDIPSGTYEINGSKPVRLNGGRYVVDLKTGKSVYRSHHLQLAAYAAMMQESAQIDGAIIIHTGASTRSGMPGLATVVRSSADLSADFSIFESVFRVWQDENENIKPRVMEVPTIISPYSITLTN